MRKIFDEELEKLSEEMLQMGSLVERITEKSLGFIKTKQDSCIEEVFEYEKHINEMENIIQTHCLRLLIEYQPFAKDLRYISSILKMITDLKRIGEQAKDIAKICVNMNDEFDENSFNHIQGMAKSTMCIINKTLNSFAKSDIELAKSIEKKDDVVDNYFKLIKEDLIQQIKDGATASTLSLDFIMIAKYLERTADHAVNISRWIIFSIEG